MIVLGLTGSIGMGKSTTAGFFRAEAIPVYDADAAVHDLYRNEAIAAIQAEFPSAVADGKVDRSVLRELVIGKQAALAKLEALIHPLVRERERRFINHWRQEKAPLVVLDIPLLFETNGNTRCDAVAVVSARPDIQRSRVLARGQMTAGDLAAILAKQMPDGEKRKRAHFIVDSSEGFDSARRQVKNIIAVLAGRS